MVNFFWNDPSMSPRNKDTDKGEISIYVESMKKHWMSFELTTNLFELIKSSKRKWIRPLICREGEKKSGGSSDKHRNKDR